MWQRLLRVFGQPGRAPQERTQAGKWLWAPGTSHRHRGGIIGTLRDVALHVPEVSWICEVCAEHLRPNFHEPTNNSATRVTRIAAGGNVRESGTEPFDKFLREVSVATVMGNLHPVQGL